MDLDGSQVVVEPNLLTEGDVPVIEPVAAESPPTSPHAAAAAVVVDENSNQSEPEAVGGGQMQWLWRRGRRSCLWIVGVPRLLMDGEDGGGAD